MLKNAARKSLTTLDIELGGSMGGEEGESEPTTAVGTPVDDDTPEDDGFEETVITTRRRRVRGCIDSRIPGVLTLRLQLAPHRRSLPARFSVSKEHVDASAQHVTEDFTSTVGVQTTDATPTQIATASTQTSPPPSPFPQVLAASTSSDSSARDVFDETLVNDDDEQDEPRSASSFTLASLSPLSNAQRQTSNRSSSRFLKGVDLPPSYAHLEAEERVRRDYIERYHPDMSPTRAGVSLPSSSAASPRIPNAPISAPRNRNHGQVETLSFDEVSREAVERWKSLKQELGFECDVIDKALESRRPITPHRSPAKATLAVTPRPPVSSEEYLKTMTPRLAREWFEKIKSDAEAGVYHSPTPSPDKHQRTPRWQFYNMYNSVFYPTAESAAPAEPAPKRGWNITLTTVGVWALVLMTGKFRFRPLPLDVTRSFDPRISSECNPGCDEIRDELRPGSRRSFMEQREHDCGTWDRVPWRHSRDG